MNYLISSSTSLRRTIKKGAFLRVFGLLMVCLALSIVNPLLGQNTIGDSISQILESEPEAEQLETVVQYASALRKQEDFESSLLVSEMLLKHFDIVSNDSLQYLILNLLGVNYIHSTAYPKAAKQLIAALKLAEKRNDTAQIFQASGNYGSLQTTMNEWDAALEYYVKGLELIEGTNFQVLPSSYITRIINIASVFNRKKEFAKAREWLDKGLVYMEDHELETFLSSVNIVYGMTYQLNGELEKALPYLRTGLKASLENGQQRMAASGYQNIAGNFDELGQHDSAIVYLNIGIEIAKKLKLKNMEEHFLRGLSKNNYELGNYKEAVDIIRQRLAIRDELYGQQRKEKIAELEEKYEAEKRLLEIEKLKTENQQNQLFSVGLIALLLLVALGFTVYFFRNRLQTSNRIASLKQKALRAQMNPHFTFNALSAIQNSLLKDDKVKASDFLARFARLTRRILVSASEDEVSLEEELDQLDLYLSLEQLRMNNHFEFEIQVDESIDREMQRVPTLLLQPFLENAIWHGMTHKPTPGKIQVKVSPEKGLLRIVIEDNGVGREEASQKRATSSENSPMGMRITKERLELYRLQHRNTIGIAVEDLKDEQQQPKGTRVELLIPA